MSSFKSNPLFYGTLLTCGVLTAAQAFLIYNQRSAAARAEAEIERKTSTLAAFSNQNPFPSRENLAAVEANLAEVEKTRAEIRELLQARSEIADRIAAARVPTTPTESYFDIASFVEELRTNLRARRILTAADNRFGFSLYANTGPERDLIPSVFRQRQHLAYLINALVESGPSELGEVRRERPLTPQQRKQLDDALAFGQTPPTFGADSKDFFVIESRMSAKVPGFVTTEAYRIDFRGNTLVLRAFLNELVSFKLPVVVRSVEVVAPNQANRQTTAAPVRQSVSFADIFGGADGNTETTPQAVEKPLVDQEDSNFSVTVEFLALVEKPAAEEAAPETL